MEATVIGAAATRRRTVLLALVVASLACAPWSWIVDGLTPSWVVYPIVLLVGLWRMRRGGGPLYFGIAAASSSSSTSRGHGPPSRASERASCPTTSRSTGSAGRSRSSPSRCSRPSPASPPGGRSSVATAGHSRPSGQKGGSHEPEQEKVIHTVVLVVVTGLLLLSAG